MPHTNRKKKGSGSSQTLQKPIHTKRQQVEGDDGWTHVIEGKKHASHAKAKSISQEPWLHGGDFMLKGISYIDRTLQEMTAEQEYFQTQWEASDAYAALKTQLEARDDRVPVDSVVCLGLGSLQSSRREGRRASHTQLAALRTIIQNLNLPTPLQCHLQDPQFTTLDKEYLSSLGYTIVEDPTAYSHITKNSLVYAIHCYAEIYEKVSYGPRPALLVSTDVRNFDRYTPSELTGPDRSLEAMVEGCEELDFPQVRHDFSDTKLYWRRTTTSTPIAPDLTTLQDEPRSETITPSEVEQSQEETSTTEITREATAPEVSSSEPIPTSETTVSKANTPEVSETNAIHEVKADEQIPTSSVEVQDSAASSEAPATESTATLEASVPEAVSDSKTNASESIPTPVIQTPENPVDEEVSNSESTAIPNESISPPTATAKPSRSKASTPPDQISSETAATTEVAVPERPVTAVESPRQSRIPCYPL